MPFTSQMNERSNVAILANKNSRVLVQGMTGREGRTFTDHMIAYGTNVVGGVTPHKGGEWGVRGRPVFDTVRAAVNATEADISVVAVAAQQAVDAVYEAVDAGIRMIICITEGIPMQDMMRLIEYVRGTSSRLIGANSPGILIPSECSIGIMPWYIATRGGIGVVSRSGSLMYEVTYGLTIRELGQSALVGIGGDSIVGTSFVDILEYFEDDHETEAVVLIGELGGRMELDAARFIKSRMSKPVYALITGGTAPQGVRMGHAGAHYLTNEESAGYKLAALRDAGARVADRLEDFYALFTH